MVHLKRLSDQTLQDMTMLLRILEEACVDTLIIRGDKVINREWTEFDEGYLTAIMDLHKDIQKVKSK